MSNNHIYLTAFRDRRTIIPSEMPIDEIIQGVYCGFDSRNGEPLYVGLSENIRNRIYQHIQQLNRRSKTKTYWDEDFKNDPSLIEWKLLEVVENREQLNAQERRWWITLGNPRFNQTDISTKPFRTGGDTRRRFPGWEKLSSMRKTMTVPEIAVKLGVTKSAVYGWLRDPAKREIVNDGFIVSKSQRTRDFLNKQENIELMKKEIDSGLGFRTISLKYDLEKNLLQEILSSHGYAVTRYSRQLNGHLLEKFPKSLIEDVLNQERLSLTQLTVKLGISYGKTNTLVELYDLRNLLRTSFSKPLKLDRSKISNSQISSPPTTSRIS